jgi:MerR family copper efflux transcriptional regulator
LKISELSLKTGVCRETIRYYEKEGILPNPSKTENGYRDYSLERVVQLKMICIAKNLGFTLKEIKSLAKLAFKIS